MSIKIKVSYTDEGEKRLILKLLRPLLEKGAEGHPKEPYLYTT